MNANQSPALAGRVASIHLHPEVPGAAFQAVEVAELVSEKGIRGDTRYFGRLSRDGKPTHRQVSLIEREHLAEHAAALGMQEIPPGAVRSNIETTGLDLVALLGKEVQIGEAILFLHSPRDPCAKMDAICQGLRERMSLYRQGVLAEVRRSGSIRTGDVIRVVT